MLHVHDLNKANRGSERPANDRETIRCESCGVVLVVGGAVVLFDQCDPCAEDTFCDESTGIVAALERRAS